MKSTAAGPPRRTRLTLRARVAVLTSVAVALAVAATALGLFLTLRSQLYGQFEQDLVTRANAGVNGALADPSQIAQLPADAFGGSQWALLTSDRRLYIPQGGEQPPVNDTEFAVASGEQSQTVRVVKSNGDSARMVAVPAGGGTALVLYETTDSVDKALRDVSVVLLLIGFLGVAGAAVVGYAVARAGLRPVAELTAAAERVAATEDLTPIEVRSDDEIGRLAQSFNAMLVSLGAGRERERRLVADAGHELRTPLTSIRTNLDLLAQANSEGVDLPAADRVALLADVRAQITELGDLIGDLVQLSQGAPDATSNEEIDLSAIVDRAVERVRRRAPGVVFDVDVQPWWVVGDATSLERAVTNLLDNAAKWSPPAGTVRVRLHAGRLSVADEGPGIPEADQTRVFERFYRSSAARGMPGSGLGLAIVAQTTQQHQGTVQASSAPAGGALVTLTLPGSAEEATTGT